MLEYRVAARRLDAHGAEVTTKVARLVVDIDLAGRLDAFNPAELLMAALAACILKGVERVAPMLKFAFSGIEVSLQGVRQDAPPKMLRIDYAVVVATEESDQRLNLLLRNVQKYGTVHNSLTGSVEIVGTIARRG
ncbi:MAG: OsmC family protein [bacterium]